MLSSDTVTGSTLPLSRAWTMISVIVLLTITPKLGCAWRSVTPFQLSSVRPLQAVHSVLPEFEVAANVHSPHADDPWVRGFWARRLKRRAHAVAYYSLSPASHCPQHEVPVTVNTLLSEWLAAQV
jgi:pimeloyl-ACP methyl ester carboxylesterase